MTADDKIRKQDYLPFPPTPSASIAGRTMQESIYKRRVEPRRLPADSPNILIVLIDDAGPGLPSTLGGEVQTSNNGPRRDGRDLAQPLPHYGHVLTHTSVHTDRPESSPRRCRADRGVGERLGRILGPHPQEQRPRCRSAQGLRLQYGRLWKVAQHACRGNDRRWPLRKLADRIWVSNISTDSWPARPRSMSPTWCGTLRSSCRPRAPEEGYHLSEDLADDAIGG